MSLFDIENQNDEISEKKTPSASKETKKNMNTYTQHDGRWYSHEHTDIFTHTHTLTRIYYHWFDSTCAAYTKMCNTESDMFSGSFLIRN